MIQLLIFFISTLFIYVSANDLTLHFIELPSTMQSLYGTTCVEATKAEFHLFVKTYKNLVSSDPQMTELLVNFTHKIEVKEELKECQSLFGANRVHHDGIADMYRYGNWCGVDYGGFDNHCVKNCLENKWHPSSDCIACNTPVDYVDEQCMYHDFCTERFEKFQIGNGSACLNSLSLGHEFLAPCACPINITQHLLPVLLADKCKSFDCSFNGGLIYTVFVNPALTCTCTFERCIQAKTQKHMRVKNLVHFSHRAVNVCDLTQSCTSVDYCIELHGVDGDADEGL